MVSTNTTPQLLKALESHKIEPEKLVTHYFKLSEIEKAYEVFSQAADHHAIKVIIENDNLRSLISKKFLSYKQIEIQLSIRWLDFLSKN